MRLSALLVALALAAPAAAQEHQHGRHDDHAGHSDHASRARDGNTGSRPKPAGWVVRLDRPDRGSADDVLFTDMPPGWHVTTGPAALLHHPDSSARGDYRLEAEMFLFDPGERREGYGIFFGGRDLEGAAQEYIYFLLRRDGSYLVKTRHGENTSVVRDWTRHPAVVGWDDRPADSPTALNRLAVQVGSADVVFLANDVELVRVPRSELPSTDGIFGLRVNHALNLHVTGVRVGP